LDVLGTHPHETGTFDNHKVFHKTGDRTHAEFVWTLMGYLGQHQGQ